MSPRPRLAVLAVGAALPALVASVVLAPPATGAVPITCGATLTGHVTLATDITCTGDGFTLVGDVTLDLGGHTLAGPAGSQALLLGLDATQTVTNGRIEGWGLVASADLPADDTGGLHGEFAFADVTFAGNGTVVDLGVDSLLTGHSAMFDVADSAFEGNDQVFSGIFGGSAVVRSSRFVGNGTVVGIDTAGIAIRGSHLQDNDVVVAYLRESYASIEDSTLVDNRVVSQGGDFFSVFDLVGNEVSGSDTVLAASELATSVTSNRLVDNDVAIDLGAAYGWVSSNTFRGNRIAFTSAPGEDTGWTTTYLEDNTFVGNGDAVVTSGSQTRVGRNTAHHNDGWGIYAPGVTDLGGNRAWSNGRSPQCVGVVCAYRPRS